LLIICKINLILNLICGKPKNKLKNKLKIELKLIRTVKRLRKKKFNLILIPIKNSLFLGEYMGLYS